MTDAWTQGQIRGAKVRADKAHEIIAKLSRRVDALEARIAEMEPKRGRPRKEEAA